MQVSIVVKEKYYVEVLLLTPHEVCLACATAKLEIIEIGLSVYKIQG